LDEADGRSEQVEKAIDNAIESRAFTCWSLGFGVFGNNVARHSIMHGFDAQPFAGSAHVSSALSALARTIGPYFDCGGDAKLSMLRTLADRMSALHLMGKLAVEYLTQLAAV
jgi:hypothetical protein